MKLRCLKSHTYKDATFNAGEEYVVDGELGRRLLQDFGPENRSEFSDVRFEAVAEEEAETPEPVKRTRTAKK